MLMIQLDRCVNLISQFLSGLLQFRSEISIIAAVLNHLLGTHSTLGMGAGGELVAGSANAITGGEETVNCGHTVVAPFVLMGTSTVNGRNPILIRTGNPDTAAAGM